MNIREFAQSHRSTIGLFAIGMFVLLLASFSLGQYVGYRKASFAFQNGNNFYNTYGPRRGMMPGTLPPPDFSDAHGSAGKVVGITLPTITIEDRDGTEKTIVIDDKTTIRKFRDTITAQDIAIGDQIVAIGEPNAQSQIAASLIRILPSQ
jgi:hypothetical protein